MRVAALLVLPLIIAAPASAHLDNDVQWQGVSHLLEHDLSPRVPIDGSAFTVTFQTFRDDVTSARLRIDDGSLSFIDAAKVAHRGPYDIWEATVPATGADSLTYTFEITDGSDTDHYSASGMSEVLDLTDPFTVDYTTLEHARLGATVVPGGVVFKVWAPSASSAHVRGDFNGWTTSDPLTKVGEHFVGFVPGAVHGQRYKYFFNSIHWRADPRSPTLQPTDNYNSQIIDHDLYEWQNPEFGARPMEELVVYQLHVGTFAGRNDPFGPTPNPSRYLDVANRAQHLAELGVNAVMVNPIHEFPGDFSGGYMSVSPFAIESKLGSPDDFKRMVDELHQAGIAVLLDIVPNHASISDNILWNFDGSQIYFDSPAIDTPWGAQCDVDRAGVFDFYLDSFEEMLTEYRLDGFRMDAVMYLTDGALTPQWSSGQALVRAMNDRIDNRHVDKHTIAEIYIDSPWVTDPTSSGLGFTAQYQNEFKEAVRAAVFDAAFGDPDMWRIANVLDGQGFGVSGQSAFNYFELHDDAWPLNGHDRAVKQIDTTFPHDDNFARGRTIIGNSLALLSRGVPAILQGTEWLEDDGWEASKIDWGHKSSYSGIFRYYSDLIALRTSEPALYANSPISTFHVNDSMNVMAFERYRLDGGSFVALVNLSNSDRNGYRIGIPRDGRWDLVINSNDPIYDGPGGGTPIGQLTIEAVASGPHSLSVVLDIPARSILLLQHVDAVCPGDANQDGVSDLADLNIVLSNFGSGSGATLEQGDLNGDGAVDLADLNAILGVFGSTCP